MFEKSIVVFETEDLVCFFLGGSLSVAPPEGDPVRQAAPVVKRRTCFF